MGKQAQRPTGHHAVCGLVAAALCVMYADAAWGQTAEIRLVAPANPSPSDVVATLPTSQSYYLNDAVFVVEVWAQTSNSNGLSSVSADVSFDPALANLTAITHSTVFGVLTHGAINNLSGLVDDLSGSHLGPCTDALGVAPNWARVATLDASAMASGVLTFQSAATGSAVYNTSLCGVGDIPDAQVAFGSVTVTLVDCLFDTDCDNGQYCDGSETCNLGTHTCQPGTSPTCDDQIDCTDDSCDPAAAGGAGACVNTANNPNCTDFTVCTIDACDQLGAPGTGCSHTPDNTACNDSIDCTVDACDQLGEPGMGCSYTPNNATCTDSIDCTVDACDQLGAPGTGCSYSPNDALCDDFIACTVDVCDQLNGPGSGCSNTPNDAFCDNTLFCDGVETCSATVGCLTGSAPCTAGCEHCVESTGSCGLCIFDLDLSGVMGTGDFSEFAPCFGACYPPVDPCRDSNFDQDAGGCVGTSDFAAFVGCFGDACSACAGCAGPGGGLFSTASTYASTTLPQDPIDVRLIPRRFASKGDVAAVLPRSDFFAAVGEQIHLEVWARVDRVGDSSVPGLASAYLDLRLDRRRLEFVDVLPSVEFALFAQEWSLANGVLHSLGGCAGLGRMEVGGRGEWVKVATVAVRTSAPGSVTVVAKPSDELHGFARVGMFRNTDPSLLSLENTSFQIGKQSHHGSRR